MTGFQRDVVTPIGVPQAQAPQATSGGALGDIAQVASFGLQAWKQFKGKQDAEHQENLVIKADQLSKGCCFS